MSTPRPDVLLVDSFDSFTFNLVDELARRGAGITVVRNDRPAHEVLARARRLPGPPLIVLSPGPGAPEDAGCLLELVRDAGALPVFGVCLGLQAMVVALGGRVGPAGEIVHGKASPITHDGRGVFAGLPSPMAAARYHSLAALALPDVLAPTARAAVRGGDLIMAVRHRSRPLAGVQFHPESILTPHGGRLLDNVLRWAVTASS